MTRSMRREEPTGAHDVTGQQGARYWWPLSRGEHSVGATVWRHGELIASVEESLFVVK